MSPKSLDGLETNESSNKVTYPSKAVPYLASETMPAQF